MTAVSETHVYPFLGSIYRTPRGVPAHFRCIGQASRAASRAGHGCKSASRPGSTGRHPVTEASRQHLPGDRGHSSGFSGWQNPDRYYTPADDSDGVYSDARAKPGLADRAAIRALEWTRANHENNYSQSLHAFVAG